MKAVCINNKKYEIELTIGKSYDVLKTRSPFSEDDRYKYFVESDDNKPRWFSFYRFQLLEDNI